MTEQLIVVDIGGTKTRVATIKNNVVEQHWIFATEKNDAIKTLDEVIKIANLLDAKYAAVCMPGPSDFEKGISLDTPNLRGTWLNFNVKEHLLKNTKLIDIFFENDANVMAFGNHKAYDLNEKDVTQFFTISTGLGAGLIINNKIFLGANRYAQEVAKAPTAFDKTNTDLGPGSLEYYVSGSWIEKQAQKQGLNLSTKEIFESYKSNSESKKLIDKGIETLASTFAIAMAFINPNYFIVGGSVAHYNWWYVEAAFEMAKSMTTIQQYENVKLLIDKFADDSALIGLNYWLKDKLEKKY
ncbi:ROK family protein [Mycoplasmopsis agassizii]|uniref:ROK family protein n=1 Tax=Mycoplasmopsis agassizii TaxID=33922 RepID=A0ABX4H5G7_9BACT|nr:ROK family protein [Mycoplasmopsis agassizii]PAF55146.1 ROK family protein [Mycoplasmopsis agassizii]SMC16760.1 glucokinase [Mycoplasmopsis agassizii]